MKKFLTLVALTTLVGFAGCDTVQEPLAPTGAAYIRLSLTEPPLPYPEDIIPVDDPRTQIWRPGYWDYDGSSFSWVSGAIIQRPSPLATWDPDRWIPHNYGWAFRAGHWQ